MAHYKQYNNRPYDIDPIHIYEVEVVNIKRCKHLLWSKGGHTTPYTVGLIARSSIDAVFTLVDAGFTPLKVLNPQRHD